MTVFAVNPETLKDTIAAVLGARVKHIGVALGEVTVVVAPSDYLDVAKLLRDAPGCCFEQMMDLCGVDYSEYKDGRGASSRFCVVLHLLSVSLNQRVRLKVFPADDEMPVLASVVDIWNAANWYEREAFDLFGIVFEGHNDLRRILTDYGFVGHPFRKDFPLIGNVEVRYDAVKKRVVYEPVSIEPRIGVPRVVREDSRYGQAQAEAALNNSVKV